MSNVLPEIDDLTPTGGSLRPFPIVGVGASAGGLAAFEAFFSGMPAEDPGVAFVLVQHLSPDHKSILASLIQRATRLPVREIENNMAAQPGHVYIIPPNRSLTIESGKFQLIEPVSDRRPYLPVDTFFRSLALDQEKDAICIVLSGSGNDGTLGARAIKENGGMVMAQVPGTAEYDGMPRSVIEAGLADYQLAPAEMASQLLSFLRQGRALKPHRLLFDSLQAASDLRKIFGILLNRTGHDFTLYKPSTIYRRIERRLLANGIDSLESYVELLKTAPKEVDALFRDMLIGVTSFFRDPEAFDELEQRVIPLLFNDDEEEEPIRVWSAGCSTGEEAYSIAILLAEFKSVAKRNRKIQIFATDIDTKAIASARTGIYPASIAANVSPERLARHFTPSIDGSSYRIHKSIRDTIIFSEHNLIKDPPFSRLDLISCRNLLIYLSGELQKRLIPVFHYSLKPGRFLFLGNSSSIGDANNLFDVFQSRFKIYQRKFDMHQMTPTLAANIIASDSTLGSPPRQGTSRSARPTQLPVRELTERALLQGFTPAAALVDARGDLLYLHGRTGQYLEPAPGESGISNILKMAREGLRYDLGSALHRAAATNTTVQCPGLRVKTNGHYILVDLTVSPISNLPAGRDSRPTLFLVSIQTPPASGPALDASSTPAVEALPAGAEARIAALKRELQVREDFLSATNEELEATNEELSSSNEEMQSINEELHSTNEELETSKEELQSLNEELATVNSELQSKVSELSQANNDMNNMLAGTGIGTVFIDRRLQILRFTPTATSIINLIPGDIGRPVHHIVSNLVGYDALAADAQEVIATLVPFSREVRTMEGKSFSMRIQPYRTLENVIEGAVITFTEITGIVQTRELLRQANESVHLGKIVHDASDAFIRQDLDGRIQAWNPAAERIYGWSEEEALSRNSADMRPPELRGEDAAKAVELAKTGFVAPYRTQRLTRDGKVLNVIAFATALVDEFNKMYGIATMERGLVGRDYPLPEMDHER